jgi:predicted alpha/beta superfamily hydrolase
MHDAQNLFDSKTSYVEEWNIDEKLDSINAELIVIGIEHGNDKRMDELTLIRMINMVEVMPTPILSLLSKH